MPISIHPLSVPDSAQVAWPTRFPLLMWLRHPGVQLALLGGLSWLCYLHLTLIYPLPAFVARYPLTDFGKANHWSRAALLDFLISIFGAFSLYLAAWQVISRRARDQRLIWLIVAVGMLLAATLLFMYPITAIDLFDYVFHSRIFVHYHQNPMVVPPNAFSGDPFLRFVSWGSQPSPYGPMWLLFTVPGSLLGGDNLILNLYLMKALVILAYLGATLLIWAILQQHSPAQRLAGTLLFAWNPLVLFETAGNGHNDMLMMFFALLAVYLLVRKKWAWVLPALVVAVLVKYVMVLLLPPFLIYCWKGQGGWRNRLNFIAGTGAVCILLAVVVVRFFIPAPRGLLREADFYSLLAAPTLLFSYLRGTGTEKTARLFTATTSLLVFVPVYALSLRGMAGKMPLRRLALWSTWLVAAYLVLACLQFQPWFAIWPIALGIWVDDRLTRRLLLVFTATALLSYAANFWWNWNIHSWKHLQVNVMFVTVIFVPLFVVWLWAIGHKIFSLNRVFGSIRSAPHVWLP